MFNVFHLLVCNILEFEISKIWTWSQLHEKRCGWHLIREDAIQTPTSLGLQVFDYLVALTFISSTLLYHPWLRYKLGIWSSVILIYIFTQWYIQTYPKTASTRAFLPPRLSHILVVAKLQLWSQPEPGGLKDHWFFFWVQESTGFGPFFCSKSNTLGKRHSGWCLLHRETFQWESVRIREQQSVNTNSISKSAIYVYEYKNCLVTTFLLKAMPTPHLHLRSSKVRDGCCDLFQISCTLRHYCMHGSERTDPSAPFVNLSCLGGIVDHPTATFSASQAAVLQKNMHWTNDRESAWVLKWVELSDLVSFRVLPLQFGQTGFADSLWTSMLGYSMAVLWQWCWQQVWTFSCPKLPHQLGKHLVYNHLMAWQGIPVSETARFGVNLYLPTGSIHLGRHFEASANVGPGYFWCTHRHLMLQIQANVDTICAITSILFYV